MVGVAPDERKGRRLPQWILGTSAADKVKSENIQVNKKLSEEEPLSHACHFDSSTTKIRSRKKSLLPEKEKALETSHVLVKCKTKRRKQKEKQEDVDSENKILEKVPEKKYYNRNKRRTLESASRNKPKTKEFGFKSIDNLEIQPLSEDENVELTVEDLMTIAEEYVRAEANKNMDQDQAAKGTCELRIRPPVTVPSMNESKDFKEAHSVTDDTSASYYRTSAAHDVSAPCESNSSTEKIAINARATGDPAQDMLDLFLGPLLRKPVEEKKTDSVVEDAAFSQDFGIQSKHSMVREDIAPPIKKKSSLKDKVAMFLD